MKKQIFVVASALGLLLTFQCTEKRSEAGSTGTESTANASDNYGGFESQIKWGEHLVIIGGCNDCHTPKKMSPHGPVLDTALWLSGHPANMPRIDVNQKDIGAKGLVVTSDLTEWVGPWGVSFTANLTPDQSGIGNWTEEQFMVALRQGKSKGLPAARPLLPPMPWEMYQHMTDDEIKAVFAYLKSIKPISNIVPGPIPPDGAAM
jgi:mono/diheme cytochrome c family protein